MEAIQQHNHLYNKDFYSNDLIIANLSNNVQDEFLMVNPYNFSILIKNIENYKINQCCKQLKSTLIEDSTFELSSNSWVSLLPA